MKRLTITAFGAGALAILTFYACSLIGIKIGSTIDKKHTQRFIGWEMSEIKPNKPVELVCKDNTRIKGRFAGAVKLNPQTDTTYSGILLRTPDGAVKSFPLTAIDHVEIHSKWGKITGSIIGGCIDGLLIAAAMGSNHRTTRIDKSDWSMGSCPLISSYDGSAYHLEAQILTGAIFKAAERPDWANLEHLKETNGVYRLKVNNGLAETEEIDLIHLMVVDHPANTCIYPSFSGQLYTLSNPQTPRSARDFAGVDVKDLIRRNDDRFWLSNPFGRDPNNPADLRDGLILEFERSATASSAALLLNVQNTLWASELETRLLSLSGRQLPQWCDTLNNSAEARNEFARAIVREAVLRVYVWDDALAQWRSEGYVREAGSVIDKDVVVDLDLIGLQGNTIRVKLECPPGIWMLNSAQLDCSYSTIPTLSQTLVPQKAVDQNGRDLLPLLEKADSRYYEMPGATDEAMLEFAAPPRRPGMQRSFILKGGGYYSVHPPTDAEPQMKLLHYLLREPGALIRNALESLYRETDAINKNVLQ